ncbi:hypothetical protein K8354_15420 [Polaribacter litorisediminis]|uniref:hypothetical protein n=1 Tax=Polaribacter litorisediminis TaxID=1908341 RepID=UPI001CBFCE2F|nr:hypothetical protein [Polaribacter litorisediminis]UAM97673.1 hypothetical protein K8354_15420 [Polaribacter litorisediminis]
MKKISSLFLIFSSFVYSQGINSGLFFSQAAANSSKAKKVIITFDAPPNTVNVKTSYYKYNKEFAFSFGMDDGLIGAYNTAVPLFTGGTVIHQDGLTEGYPGLFYSDGAGTTIPFAATMNVNMKNIGVSAGANMSEAMLRDAYIKGFALTNHGFTPRTQFDLDGWDDDPVIRDQQIRYEIEENYNQLKAVIGIKIDNFTAPSNDDSYHAITTQMKTDGFLKIVNNIGNPSRDKGHDFTAEYWMANEATRWFSRDFTIWTEGAVNKTPSDFDFINTKLAAVGNEHAWFTLGVHNVDISETGSTGGASLKYLDFKYVMEGLELNYGIKGADNIWMAPINMVYEYLISARDASYSVHTVGNKATISFNFSAVNPKFLEHALSLIVDADTNITNIAYEGFDVHSSKINYQNLGNHTALINVAYQPPYHATAYQRLEAVVAVNSVKATLSQSDLEYAQGLVNALPPGNFKEGLAADLENIKVVLGSVVIKIDFGRSLHSYISPYPWNNLATPDAPGHLAGAKLTNMDTTTSTKSGIDLEVIAPFENYDANFSGTNGDPQANFPFEAERDCFKTPAGLTSTLRLTNLNENKVYDFTAFSSRNVIGTATEITINGETVTIDHKKNLYDLVSINNVVPNAGGILEIHIKGTGSSNVHGFLNVLQITEKNP